MILCKIIRNRICKASAFFFSKPWPLWAPARRAFINIWALIKKRKIYLRNFKFAAICSRFPVVTSMFSYPLEGKIGILSFPDIVQLFLRDSTEELTIFSKNHKTTSVRSEILFFYHMTWPYNSSESELLKCLWCRSFRGESSLNALSLNLKRFEENTLKEGNETLDETNDHMLRINIFFYCSFLLGTESSEGFVDF